MMLKNFLPKVVSFMQETDWVIFYRCVFEVSGHTQFIAIGNRWMMQQKQDLYAKRNEYEGEIVGGDQFYTVQYNH